MMKIAAVAAALFCATAYASVTTQEIDGGGTALIVSGTAYTQEEADALNNNAVTELWKTGDTTLVSEGIGSFTGIIRVKGGIFRISAAGGLGTTAGATYVESGATLEHTNAAKLAEPMFLEGTGADGLLGAYHCAATASGGGLSGKTTLTGDALFNGQHEWYLYSSELDMGGHTLTITNATKQCVFQPGAITDPGHLVVTKGALWIHNGAKMTAGPEHTITVTNAATLSLYGYKTLGANWKIRYVSTSTGNGFYISSTSSANPSHWYGPIEIPSGYTMYASLAAGASDYGWNEFWGPITGDGNFQLSNGNVYEGVRLYGTNTYTGVTSAPDSGQMWFMQRKALPTTDPAKFTVPAKTARMILPLRASDAEDGFLGWTLPEITAIYAIFDAETAEKQPFWVNVGAGETLADPYVYDRTQHPYNRRQFLGGGTVRLTGDFVGRPQMRLAADANDGTLVVIDGAGEGRHNEYGQINFYDGRFLLKDVNHWFTSAKDSLAAFNVNVESTSPKSRVTFGPGTSMGQTVNRKTEAFNLVYEAGTAGTLEFLEGSAFTNRLAAAKSEGQSAAIYQRGGTVYLTNGGGNDGYLGNGGYCFYEKSGGTLAIRAWTRLGASRSGAGLFHGKGDWTFEDASFAVSAGGTGVLYQTSGTFSVDGSTSGALAICNANYASSWGGNGNVTVRGADACISMKNDAFYMSDCSKSQSFVNMMDGGTLRMAQLKKQGLKTYRTGNDITEAYAYVNFNGGVLKSNGKNKNLFGADEHAPDRVTVFAGGAILDSDTYTVTNNIALQAPTGKGIASIALPEGFDATGYMGPPVVGIVGDGTGATAVCEFDSENQRVTGITVTSPGWNYTTATVTLALGGKTNVTACAVTLADNATTGGLTKRGSGTVVLSEANTYGGATRIEAGTLEIANASALPAGSEVVLAGGTLAVGAGVTGPDELTVDLAGYGEEGGAHSWALMTWADGAPASAPVVQGLPSGWMTQCAGGALVLRRIHGTAVSVR